MHREQNCFQNSRTGNKEVRDRKVENVMTHVSFNTRIVDIHEYVPVLRELIDQGKEVSITITGNSMSPFLAHGRDQVLLKKPSETLKKGDMVFYQRDYGGYVLHRICKVKNEKEYFLVGDGQTFIEGPLRRDQIFGIVTSVRRKGKWLSAGSFWWDFYRYIWLNIIPLRPIIRKAYGMLKNDKNMRNGD